MAMVTSTIVSKESEVITLDDYMRNPPEMEWVDGQLLEKNDMTLKHGRMGSSRESLPDPPLRNRTCDFHRIRLLGTRPFS